MDCWASAMRSHVQEVYILIRFSKGDYHSLDLRNYFTTIVPLIKNVTTRRYNTLNHSASVPWNVTSRSQMYVSSYFLWIWLNNTTSILFEIFYIFLHVIIHSIYFRIFIFHKWINICSLMTNQTLQQKKFLKEINLF